MQTTLTGGQNMANADGIPSPNWSTYNMPPRTLDTPRATESGVVGKLDSGTPVAALLRLKPPANWLTS